ncbi:MAG: hypothetical protein EXR77_19950 [Myxococcales bacterium]|nr:hypothetical protein [Myxococcales bacterium]
MERVAPTTATGKAGQPKPKSRNCVDLDGFNLHADVRIHEVARERLEHLVRYICRPVIAAKRLERVGEHKVRITFKNEWKGGITGVTLTKRDLAYRIIGQIPLPRLAMLRYHGIFGPAAKDREQVVPARGGRVAHNQRKGKTKCEAKVAKVEDADTLAAPGAEAASPAQPAIKLIGEAATKYGSVANDDGGTDSEVYSTKMTWAQALQRAFKVDILICEKCGGTKEVIATIPTSAIVTKILRHLGLPTKVVTKAEAASCDIWRVRGPSGEVTDDFGDDEPQVHADAIDEEYEEIELRPFFDDEEVLPQAA